MARYTAKRTRLVRLLTAYDAAGEPADFVIPEDLSALTDEQLATLHTEAVGHFDALYGDGAALSDTDLAALATLTEGIESLLGELSTRQAAATERATTAAELASRVHTETRTEEIRDTEEEPPAATESTAGENPEENPEGAPAEPGAQPVAVVAAAPPRREIRVNVANLRSRGPANLPRAAISDPHTMRDLVYAASEGTGYAIGQGVNWDDIGRIIDRGLAGINEGQFAAAQRAGRHVRQQHNIATLRRPFPEDLMIRSNDRDHVDEVMSRATDQTRLKSSKGEGSLVAAGGWCAPSEILYDFLEMESRDGLYSVPEVGISRGGIQWTTGIDFSTIYAATDWNYTEANDIAGNYAVTDDSSTTALHPGTGGAGDKPCYTVPCPTFTEARLQLAGLCLNAGLLQQRGYPEILARVTRGALVAHDHKMSLRKINAVVAGSTAVTMTTGVIGTVAPLLTAIELQVEHYRYTHRLARGTLLEAVFPYWVHGAVRSDYALRQGLSPDQAINVTDAQINAWFTTRGIAPQFVYDWQPLSGAAGAFIQWPTTMQFLLYVAGTWVAGANDVITLDTIYDSVMLGENNFTALFTEEGWLMAKKWIDSRVITVPICSNGGTGAPYELTCDGTTLVADQVNPTAGTVAGSSITTTGFTLTVSGASDTGGLAALPYRFSTDGGATWTAWQASNIKAITGLVTGTAYNTRAQIRDLMGNVSATPIVVVTTS